jgi:predicted DNA-binding mobile mystery protein A
MDIKRKVARDRLDRWFRVGFMDFPSTFERPLKGWIRTIRYALGISGRQLGDRLGISSSSAHALEKRERDGSVTLKMMERAAEAMDCTFFYMFRPNGGSFEGIVKRRAEETAARKLERLNQTMMLEDQRLPADEIEMINQQEVMKLVEYTPRSLWNDRSKRKSGDGR